jgi:hypothetical protein
LTVCQSVDRVTVLARDGMRVEPIAYQPATEDGPPILNIAWDADDVDALSLSPTEARAFAISILAVCDEVQR